MQESLSEKESIIEALVIVKNQNLDIADENLILLEEILKLLKSSINPKDIDELKNSSANYNFVLYEGEVYA